MSDSDSPTPPGEASAQRARRQARRDRRNGPYAACALCGIKTPEVLVRVDASILEKHHAAGRAHCGKLKVLLCRNCHAIVTEGQRGHGANLGEPQTILDRAIGMLRSLAAFFEALADAFDWLANLLVNFLRALCVHHPGWQTMPESAP